MLLFMVGVTYCRPFVADFADSLKTSVDCAVLVTLVLSMLLKVDLRNELYGPSLPHFRVSASAARALNAAGQCRVTLSLR